MRTVTQITKSPGQRLLELLRSKWVYYHGYSKWLDNWLWNELKNDDRNALERVASELTEQETGPLKKRLSELTAIRSSFIKDHLVITFDGIPFIVLDCASRVKDTNKILAWYSEKFEIDQSRLKCSWVDVLRVADDLKRDLGL